MSLAVPLPLGGFATELGSLTERLRALEGVRSGVTTSIVTGTWGPSSYASWTYITGWPNLTVPINTLAGVVVIYGGQGEVFGSSITWNNIGLVVDGTLVQSVMPTLNDSAPGAGGIGGIPGAATWWGPMTLGSHTFELQVSTYAFGAAQQGVWYDPFLAVIPI